MTFKCKAVLNVAFAFTFISSQAYAGVDTTPQCQTATSSSVAKKCEDAASTASGNQPVKTDNGINNDSTNAALQTGIQKALSAEGIEKCKKAVEACQPVCETASGPSKQKCERFASYTKELTQGVADNTTDGAQQQATSDATTQSAGGGGDMIGMLAGAAVGGLLGYMLAKKMNDKDKDKDDDGALLPNGQIDCSKDDAYKYRDCTTYLEVNCMNSLDSEKCKKFSAVFCAATSGSSSQSAGDAPPPAEPGAGVGTPFCKKNLAYNYCKADGRNQCPSCLGLARSNSAACQQDPSLCLAQNSPDQIATAKQSCPTDPAFADPAYASGGGTQVPTGLQTGAPAVVLPQSVNGSANAQADAKSTGSSSATSYSTSSASAASNAAVAGGSDSAVRDGQAGSVNSQASYQGSASTVAGSAGGGRELASANGGSNFKTASTGPRPDVEGPFGPSLFRTSTEVIKSRCHAGKLNNCPKSN